MKALGASARIFQLLDRKPREKEDGSILLENPKGEVSFKNVSFSYPTRPDVKVLENISFTIPSSKVIAFVGSSGSGVKKKKKKNEIEIIENYFYNVFDNLF